ncbi:alpha/beta hydrolase [Paucibacter sp. XJ19-41]|uniref:alpha/beta hydrolase n=1 Tax=Paucibacter sp. XJ19-41 TaxID=2927824 RepID=UPI0023498EF1|nr:alpha/beta fold hydrolase [Paucibacter sp. XJ19-41]MDC6167429.1 alpha/beta fold hydrolase [Paucibacter sp. XJ19-41]
MTLPIPSWRRLLLGALAALALLGGCATLDEKQREWIFKPSDRTWSGGLAAAQGMDEVWIAFDSKLSGAPVKLHGLWIPAERADAPVLLYLHGARWDVRGSANRMRRMQELGFSVLGIDYRGFGQSSKVLPSEAMAYEDARAAWDWLATQHPRSPRYIFGHSLGGAIAVNLASEVQTAAAGLIVEGSFTSIPEVASSYKWGWLPVGPLITQRFEAGERIAGLKVPVLIVHGSADRVIKPELGRALFERAPEPKRFVLVEGGSHHNTNAVGQGLYREALAELFGHRAQ